MSINLLDKNLTKGISVKSFIPAKKGVQVPHGKSFQTALVGIVGEDNLVLSEDGFKIDLDNPLVWRQKKVKTKALQFFHWLEGGNLASRVIPEAVKFLVEHQEISTKQLSAHFQKLGYTVGTANAQAGQMVTLFKLLKIVCKQGDTYALNGGNRLTAKLARIQSI